MQISELVLSQINKDCMQGMYGTIYIDIDSMQKINCDFGHEVGDIFLEFIQEKVSKICEYYKASSYRVAGDEFIAIVPSFLAEKTFELSNLLLKKLSSKEITIESYTFNYTISIGAVINKDIKKYGLGHPSWVFEMAKESCAFAKYGGSNRVVQIDLVSGTGA